MTEEKEIDWTQEERSAFDRLDREMTPPPDAEERIVAALAARGILGKRRRAPRGPWPWLLAAAAAAALFGAGLSVGRREAGAARPAPPSRFVLFLFDEGERRRGPRNGVQGVGEEPRFRPVRGGGEAEAGRPVAQRDGVGLGRRHGALGKNGRLLRRRGGRPRRRRRRGPLLSASAARRPDTGSPDRSCLSGF